MQNKNYVHLIMAAFQKLRLEKKQMTEIKKLKNIFINVRSAFSRKKTKNV